MTGIWGILNITPDSFSDGGRYLDLDIAVARARTMCAQGATMIDVGGESTRPGADRIGTAEEQRRVLPVIEALTAEGIASPRPALPSLACNASPHPASPASPRFACHATPRLPRPVSRRFALPRFPSPCPA